MAGQDERSEQDAAASGFRISEGPVVQGSSFELGLPPELSELPRFYGPPLLFAIPRDPRTIFTYWNIDWPDIFSGGDPVDRQVYLRVRKSDGTDESETIVEPMLGSYYASVTEPGADYQTEIGYYAGAGNWSPVATSDLVTMPPDSVSEDFEVDLATVPFHLSFQRLIDLFRASNGNALSAILAHLQARAITAEERDLLTPEEWEIIRAMNVSMSDLGAARASFQQDDKALRRRTEAVLGFGATSPARPFGGTSRGASPGGNSSRG